MKRWGVFGHGGFAKHLGTYEAEDALGAYAAHCAALGYPTVEIARTATGAASVEAMLGLVSIYSGWGEARPEAMRNANRPTRDLEGVHTPGPWTWRGSVLSGPRLPHMPNFECAQVLEYDQDEGLLSREGWEVDPLHPDMLLIRAAPELLSACQTAYAYLGAQECPPEGMDLNDFMVLAKLIDAIARATGRKSDEVMGLDDEPAPETA